MKSSQNSVHYRDGTQGRKEELLKVGGRRLLRKEQVSSDEIEDEGQVRSASIHWEADAHMRLPEVLRSLSSPVSSLLHQVFGPGSTYTEYVCSLGFLACQMIGDPPTKRLRLWVLDQNPDPSLNWLCSLVNKSLSLKIAKYLLMCFPLAVPVSSSLSPLQNWTLQHLFLQGRKATAEAKKRLLSFKNR